MKASRGSQNHILAALPNKLIGALQPYLTHVVLPLRKKLEVPNRAVESVFFIESGFASVVANGNDRQIEVGIIGREGMTGMSVLLANGRSPHETFMQAAGSAQMIPASKLRSIIDANGELFRIFLSYAHAFHIQTTRTNLANGRSRVEERLARWLLMADDRLDDKMMKLTHEFLSIMLGVRRAGVTTALKALSTQRLDVSSRGLISISDRGGLILASNGTYVPNDLV